MINWQDKKIETRRIKMSDKDLKHDHTEECDCGCNEEMETIFLTLEDDTEMECGILGVFEVDEKEYIALLPLEDETVLIYEYKEDGEEIELGLIEQDDVFEKVSNAFYNLYEDEDEQE